GGIYTLVVSNAAGAVTSDPAPLVVVGPPVMTTQPISQSVAPGTNVSFFATATGTAPIFYQWRKNGADIPGATGSLLTLLNVQTNDAGSYQAVATNAFGSVTSLVAMLTVT